MFDWGSASGTFSTLNLPGLDAGLSWDTSGLYTTGVLSVSSSAVPEPSTYAALLGTAALGFAALGTAALGTAALGTAALGTAALGTAAWRRGCRIS